MKYGTGGGGGAGGGLTANNPGLGGGGGGGYGDTGSGGGGGGGGGIGKSVSGSYTNTATVHGGNGGQQGGGDCAGFPYFSYNGAGGGGGGGAAFLVAAGAGNQLTNSGIVAGGTGGGRGDWGGGGGGGGGVLLSVGASLSNSGTVFGGRGGYANIGSGCGGSGGGGAGSGGAAVGANGNVTNNSTGKIYGGHGGNGYAAGLGGAGIYGVGVTLTNAGLITGGGGGAGTVGGAGGAGIQGSGAALTNSGSIVGGIGGPCAAATFGGTGGYGVNLTNSSSATNTNAITGGAGGYCKQGIGGGGGGGALLGQGSSLTNTSTGKISGGAIGVGSIGPYGPGVGISIAQAALTNDGGTISGGNGGGTGPVGLPNGQGVLARGGATIITSGAINGGVGSSQADAVDLVGANNTLTLMQGYSFVGNVVAQGGTLVFGGTANDTFDVSNIVNSPSTYSGTPQYAGFSAFAKSGSSTWMLSGTNAVGSSWTVQAGTLAGTATMNKSTLTNNATLAPGSSASPYGTLTVSSFSQSSTGALAIAASGGTTPSNSSLTVTQAATLGGTVLVNFAAPPRAGQKYTLLTAGPLTCNSPNFVAIGTQPYAAKFACDTTSRPNAVTVSFDGISQATPCTTTFVEGQSTTFDAAVAGNNPTGTVSFMNNAAPLCSGTLGATGQTSCSTTSLAAGAYSVTAAYSGDSNNAQVTSGVLQLTVLSASDFIFRDGFEAGVAGCPVF
jgi:hypothetical protein